jgi:hypothetical protein
MATNHPGAARQLIAQLENLVEAGAASVPSISDYLNQHEDVLLQTQGPGAGKGPPWRRDSATPESLRLGLIDALKRIGGPEAEQALLQALSTTGRGVEVLAISRALEELAPGRHSHLALQAAHSLLADPPDIPEPNRLDTRSKEALFELLKSQGDTAWIAQQSQQWLASPAHLDEATLKFLEKNMTAQVLPGVYQALQHPQLSDPKQREMLLELTFRFVGQDRTADELFFAVMQSQDASAKLREKAIRHLRDEAMANGGVDLALYQNRMYYLDSLQPSITDPRLLVELEKTRIKLAERLSAPR